MYPHYIDEEGYSESPIPEVFLCGWCATPLLEPCDEIWADVDGAFYPCLTGIHRPDLVSHFDRPEMQAAGFAARFPAANPGTTVYFRGAANRSKPPIMAWNPTFAAPSGSQTRAQQASSSALISVLLPVATASPYHLYRSIQSVVNQAHENWELCVAYNHAAAPFRAYLAVLANSDARIELLDCDGAAAACLPALALQKASGEYCALLAHNDEFSPSALLEAARAIAANPATVIVYTDETCIDECGRSTGRTFKPSFDPELLLQQDYIGQFACLRTSAIRKAGGFRPEFNGAQRWDVLLRISEAAAPGTIERIPLPLYNRRLAPTPPRGPESAKVLESCIARRGLKAGVREGLSPQALRLKPPMNETVGIAVFVRMGDGPQQTNVLLRSRFPSGARFFEIGIAGVYSIGCPGAPLLTLDETEAEIAVFINAPMDHINHEFFEELVAQAQRPNCGIVGGVTAGYIGFCNEVRSVPSVLDHFFAARLSLVSEAGGLAAIGNDGLQELCNKLTRLTVKKGMEVLYTPYAVATRRAVGA